jgi:hypothetical protein
MKFVKTTNWVRLRGQEGPNNEICKLDTPVTDKERVFFIPETEDEMTFFSIDMALSLTGIPYGPSSHNPDDPWGWRLYASRTEDDMKAFAEGVKKMLDNVYNQGLAFLKDKKPTVLN